MKNRSPAAPLNPQLLLLILLSVPSVILPFLCCQSDAVYHFTKKAGYFFPPAACAVYFWSLRKLFGLDWARKLISKRHRGETLFVLLAGAFVLVRGSYGLTILNDELVLLSTSMNMHFTRQIFAVLKAYWTDGAFFPVGGLLDKRPLLFPFLVSLIHDIKGYSPYNVFWLNSLLTLVLLSLIHLLGRKIAGVKAGILAVLLMMGAPLLYQSAHGGGLSILNLVMIMSTLLLAWEYRQRPGPLSLTALCYSAVLLAQTRYESVLYILPAGGLILWHWRRERKITLPWAVCFCPLFLMFNLYHFLHARSQDVWWAHEFYGSVVFSLEHIPSRWSRAVNYLFNWDFTHGNSILLSVLGAAGFAFFILALIRKNAFRAEGRSLFHVFAPFGGVILANLLVLLSYHWGQMDDPMVSRMALPLMLFMTFSFIFFLHNAGHSPRRWDVFIGIAALFIFLRASPMLAQNVYQTAHWPAREVQWSWKHASRLKDKNVFVIDERNLAWLVHLIPSLPVKNARADKRKVHFLWRRHDFSRFLVVQHFHENPRTGELAILPKYDLGPAFQLRVIEEKKFRPMVVTRLSEITAITEDDPLQMPLSEDFDRKPALEKINEYLDHWFKMLP